MPKRTSNSPASGENTAKKSNMAENAVMTREMFQQLLNGQNKIAKDLRVSLDKQREYDRNAEVSKANLYTVSSKISEVYTSQADIIDAVDFNSEDIMDLRETVRGNQHFIKENRDQNQKIMAMLLKVNERLDTLERKYLELSMEVKIKSIVINGLQEVEGENSVICAFNFLNVIDCNLLLDDIDVSYRIGVPTDAQHARSNTPRSLIVILKTIAKKRDIMRLKKYLKDSQAHKSVYM